MIAVIVPIYQRHDLERLVINRLKEQQKKHKFEIVVVGSEGEKSKALAEGCVYVECDNYPVSFKHQKGLDKCRELGAEAVINYGSDDVCCDKYWDWINSLGQIDYLVGMKDLYFYKTGDKKLYYFDGYENKEVSLGAFRYYSKKILDQIDWNLWGTEHRNKALDALASQNLKKKGIKEELVRMADIGVFCCDVKHERNITSHSFLNNCIEVDIKIMARQRKIKEVIDLEPTKREVPEDVIIEDGKKYQFESNGTSKHMKVGIYTVESYEAKLFVEKGYGIIIE
jgi:hypothetical protein